MSTEIRAQRTNNQARPVKVAQVPPLFNAEKLIEEFRGQVGLVPNKENKKKKREVVEDTLVK